MDDEKNITKIDEDVKGVQEVEEEEEEQPQFKVQLLIDQSWLVQYTYKGKAYVWTGSAEDMGDAINKAWKERK